MQSSGTSSTSRVSKLSLSSFIGTSAVRISPHQTFSPSWKFRFSLCLRAFAIRIMAVPFSLSSRVVSNNEFARPSWRLFNYRFATTSELKTHFCSLPLMVWQTHLCLNFVPGSTGASSFSTIPTQVRTCISPMSTFNRMLQIQNITSSYQFETSRQCTQFIVLILLNNRKYLVLTILHTLPCV